MATTDANGFVTIANADVFNISHFNDNAAAASAVATRVTTAEGNIADIQTALGTKVDTSTYTAGMATKVNSSTYTSGMATKVDKVTGKGLSTEDYTTEEKTKLAGIAAGANNYSLPTASTNTLGGVKVGAGLSIASGVLSATGGVTYIETPSTTNYVSARAWMFGEGTAASPALCYLSGKVSGASIASQASFKVSFNGFNAVLDSVTKYGPCGFAYTGANNDFLGPIMNIDPSYFYIYNSSASSAEFGCKFYAIFPAVFTS